MNASFNFQLLFPVFLLLIQTYVLMFSTIFILRKMSVLLTPISDNETSQVILSASIVFAVFYISSANFEPLLQAYKIFKIQPGDLYSLTFYRFGQYFLDVVGAVVIFLVLTFLNLKLLLGAKNSLLAIKSGDIPISILFSSIVISFGVLTRFITSEIINYLTPKVVIFN